MHVILWRFRVRPGREREFEAAYAPDGAWASLFKKDGAYIGSELLRATDGTYLTLDRWDSREAFEAFRARHAAEYDAMDTRFDPLLEDETPLGAVDI